MIINLSRDNIIEVCVMKGDCFMKRIVAVVLTMVMIVALVACNSNKPSNEPQDAEITANIVEKTDKEDNDDITDADGITENVNDTTSDVDSTDKEDTEEKTSDKEKDTTKKVTNINKDDPSKWSKAEVVAFYKAACKKSEGKKSVQTMSMRKNSLKASGGIGTFLSMAEPIIRGVLDLNSHEFDGITGGYENLVASDCKTVKAYKSGNDTIVEMTMVDQVDGIYGKRDQGTVGHAIFVVDGVAEAVEQFPAFDIKYKEADIKIYYTDAKLKVKINADGIIEKGTWSYVTKPVINGLYVEKIEVNNAGAVIDYKVTVGGGF